MNKKYLKEFMDENPQKFNKEFILSRKDELVIDEIKSIFESLTVIPEISYDPNDITLETDESTFGPIKLQGRYYKPVLESRLNKIKFKVKIEGIEKPVEKELYVNKTIDNCFYVNEGDRYFLVWQIVDSITFGYGKGTTFKNNINPFSLEANNKYTMISEFTNIQIPKINLFDLKLFKARISPLLLLMCKFSLDSLEKANIKKITDIDQYENHRDPEMIEKLSEYFGFKIEFSDTFDNLMGENRTIFRIISGKENGVYFSIPTDKLETEEGRIALACINHVKLQKKKVNKKIKLNYLYDDVINPSFWISYFGSLFNDGKDPYKNYEKTKGVFLSLSRLITDSVRKKAPIAKEYKDDIFGIIKYLMLNFKELSKSASNNLDQKRVRLYEYLVYPLYEYFTKKVAQIFHSPTKNVKEIEDMFTSLKPMYLIQKCITSELLRYFNSTNEFNLFGALLKWTYHGPQGYRKTVGIDQRSLHPSYTGRISLINSTAGGPGTTGTFTPFVEIYNGFFKKQTIEF